MTILFACCSAGFLPLLCFVCSSTVLVALLTVAGSIAELCLLKCFVCYRAVLAAVLSVAVRTVSMLIVSMLCLLQISVCCRVVLSEVL